MTVPLDLKVMLETWAREVPSDLKDLTEISEFQDPQVWLVSEDSRADPGWSGQLANLERPDSQVRMGRTESRDREESPAWWDDRAGLEILARWD